MLPVRAAAADTSAEQASTSTSFRHGITHTSYEGNSWAARFNNSGLFLVVGSDLQGKHPTIRHHQDAAAGFMQCRCAHASGPLVGG